MLKTDLRRKTWLKKKKKKANLVRLIPEPGDHVEDTGEEFLLLLLRIRVVVAQEGDAVVRLGVPEVYVDGLGVSDVEDAVRLRRKPSSHL